MHEIIDIKNALGLEIKEYCTGVFKKISGELKKATPYTFYHLSL
jgi:hypothetical protein